jgi:hypothetical protein
MVMDLTAAAHHQHASPILITSTHHQFPSPAVIAGPGFMIGAYLQLIPNDRRR